MANKQDIDFTYTTLDKIFRLCIGETADFSAAMYNGDFSMSLEEAQKAKHDFMATQLGLHKGSRVLDIGCGWGPFLNYCRNIGAEATGLTLSDGQYSACKQKGFDVYLKDTRTISPQDFGTFDAIVSVGAFEHFCSLEEYKEGKQETVYQDFFEIVNNLLPAGGRFFLQTMSFSKNIISPETMDLHAPKNSKEYILALSAKHLPGSWLPYGSEMITSTAAPFFNTTFISSGRLDYIETIRQWRKKLRSFNVEKYGLYIKLLLEYSRDKTFRHFIDVFRISPLKVALEWEMMDHYRIVFEKKQ